MLTPENANREKIAEDSVLIITGKKGAILHERPWTTMKAIKTEGVVCVGEARGFVVSGRAGFYMVTAGHCLPSVPPSHPMANLQERTYQKILSRLTQKPYVWAECLFFDPIADIAVLGTPDDQALGPEAEKYKELMLSASPFPIADKPRGCNAAVLSLNNSWVRGLLGTAGRFPELHSWAECRVLQFVQWMAQALASFVSAIALTMVLIAKRAGPTHV